MHANILELQRNNQLSHYQRKYLTSNMITCTDNQIENNIPRERPLARNYSGKFVIPLPFIYNIYKVIKGKAKS